MSRQSEPSHDVNVQRRGTFLMTFDVIAFTPDVEDNCDPMNILPLAAQGQA